MAKHEDMPKYTFEEAWRFLYRYGVIYLQLDIGPMIEVKTGITKTEQGLRNIIRFTRDDKEILRIFGRCWDENQNCDTDITPYKRALINYIVNAYIE